MYTDPLVLGSPVTALFSALHCEIIKPKTDFLYKLAIWSYELMKVNYFPYW